MTEISSDEILHMVIGEERKMFLRQYCLDNRKKLKECVCELIDELIKNEEPTRRRVKVIKK